MRAVSSAVSLTTHVIVVLAAVWSTTNVRRHAPTMTPIFPLPPFAEPTRAPVTHGLGVALVDGGLPVPRIDARPIDGIDASALRFMIDVPTPSGPLFARIPSGDGTPIESSLADDPPMLLAGPAAVYPDLLRQAGIHGRVVLEVVIDTLGRVERGSVVVVESAHPAFVASAQQSLLKSLFRPARVQGKAVRVRVRLPIDFVLRDGRLQG